MDANKEFEFVGRIDSRFGIAWDDPTSKPRRDTIFNHEWTLMNANKEFEFVSRIDSRFGIA
jgi:hypothetical protein